MMKGKRRGFTVVELVIVIAVVAILAAVLIPTYVNLVKKSNEANAQVEAKNLISEMLTDIILGDKDSADLLIFSKKGDDVYLHGYSSEQQRFLSYRNNPIALTTDMEKTVQATVGKLLAEGVIKQNEEVKSDNPNDWRLEKNVKTIVGSLNSKYDVVVYANYIIIDANLFAPHVHTWETAWAFDGTHHWHKCVGCDEITGKAEHVFGTDGKCGVCGAIKPTEAHTHVYNMKNVADKYRISAADCTHSAVYSYSCACGEAGNDTFEDGTPLGHNFVAGDVTTQPTCTSQGIMTYKCTRCSETKEVAIPALGHTYGADGKCTRCGAAKPGQGHTHKYSEELKKAATCTTPAEYQLVCSCGEVGSQPYTKGDPLGHAWDAGNVTTPATCKVTGVKTFTCTRCKTTKTETVPTLAHTPVVVPGKEATCTETGLTEGKKCSVCGTVIVAQEKIPAKGHTLVNVEEAATCTATGLTGGKKCSVCGTVTVEPEKVPMTLHAHYGYDKNGNCNKCGMGKAALHDLKRNDVSDEKNITLTCNLTLTIEDADTLLDGSHSFAIRASKDSSGKFGTTTLDLGGYTLTVEVVTDNLGKENFARMFYGNLVIKGPGTIKYNGGAALFRRGGSYTNNSYLIVADDDVEFIGTKDGGNVSLNKETECKGGDYAKCFYTHPNFGKHTFDKDGKCINHGCGATRTNSDFNTISLALLLFL